MFIILTCRGRGLWGFWRQWGLHRGDHKPNWCYASYSSPVYTWKGENLWGPLQDGSPWGTEGLAWEEPPKQYVFWWSWPPLLSYPYTPQPALQTYGNFYHTSSNPWFSSVRSACKCVNKFTWDFDSDSAVFEIKEWRCWRNEVLHCRYIGKWTNVWLKYWVRTNCTQIHPTCPPRRSGILSSCCKLGNSVNRAMPPGRWDYHAACTAARSSTLWREGCPGAPRGNLTHSCP